MKKRIPFKTLCILGLSLVVMVSCEKSTTLPLDLPSYEPHLMIFGNAGPLSGAQVIVRHSEPLDGASGQIPSLPDLQVVLVENNGRKLLFREDSTGYFSIPAVDLQLKPDNQYALMVTDISSQEVFQSSPVSLPEQPTILETDIEIDTSNRVSFLNITLDKIEKSVAAFSLTYIRLDSAQNDLEPRIFRTRVQSNHIYYPDQIVWGTQEISEYVEYFVRTKDNGSLKAQYFDVVVTYLSQELARYARDVNESNYFGEDIFQAIRPVFSNIETDHGLFGLYNEATVRIKIEE